MKTALVTGGGGFVGRKIVSMLLQKGVHCKVVGRNPYPDLEKSGVECLVGNIGDGALIQKACKNVDTVFHVAALAGIWGKWEQYYQTNVLGTRNVISACQSNQVENLVYTSTPSVVFNQVDIENGDETMPYASRYLCHYARSKVIAEKEVFKAVEQGLKGCAIRPHLIWGPEDPHLIPRLIERGRARKLKIVGDGTNKVDISYVDNVAHLHILAAENLSKSGSAKGQAYFIGDEQPVNLWNWINELFKRLDIPVIEKKIPEKLAYTAGTILEGIYKLTGTEKEPPMTRFVAEQLSKSHYFSHDKAIKELQYKPLVSAEQGMVNLISWIQANEK